MYVARLWRSISGHSNFSSVKRAHAGVASAHRFCSDSSKATADSKVEHGKRVRQATVLGAAAGMTSLAASYFLYDAFHVPQSVKLTKETIRNNKEAQEILGDDIVFRSDWRLQQEGDEVTVEVHAAGKKAGGMFQSTLVKSGTQWKLVKLDVIYHMPSEKTAEQNAIKLYDELHKAMKK